MKELGFRINYMEKDVFCGLIRKNMQGDSRMGRKKEWENLHGKMGRNIKVLG